jgi:hypothetical protein
MLYISLKLYAHCTSRGDAYVLELSDRLSGFIDGCQADPASPMFAGVIQKEKILYGVGSTRTDAKALLLYVIFDDREGKWEIPSMWQVNKVWIAPCSHIRRSIPNTENKKVLHSE